MCKIADHSGWKLRATYRDLVTKAPPPPPRETAPLLARQKDLAEQFIDRHKAAGRKIDIVCKRLGDGVDPREWADQMAAVLLDGHRDGWVLGRYLAGDMTEPGVMDNLMARAALDEESVFLIRFQQAIEAGKYTNEDGTLDLDRITQRARTYRYKFRGTANVSFTEASQASDEFTWIMEAVEHCPDCPDLEAGSPYTKDTIYVWPGDGSTACLYNCKCHLRRADGVTGFKPLDP